MAIFQLLELSCFIFKYWVQKKKAGKFNSISNKDIRTAITTKSLKDKFPLLLKN